MVLVMYMVGHCILCLSAIWSICSAHAGELWENGITRVVYGALSVSEESLEVRGSQGDTGTLNSIVA